MNRREAIKKLAGTGALLPFMPAWAWGSAKEKPVVLDRSHFPDNFKWGVAAAAYQTEGAWDVDGKAPSIWDTFTEKKRNIADQTNGKIATDFYNNYRQDIDLLKQLNFPIFRFSLSWPRIIPEGIGAINQQGIDFYHRVIDYCLASGIEPWVTIYHWDLPQALEDKGGWTNREIIDWFAEYVDVCTKNFGPKVKHWIVMNEPMSFTGLGYFFGYHAPGRKGLKTFLKAAHHAALCQAEGGRVARFNMPDAVIGTTQFTSHVEPNSNSYRDVKSAQKVDALMNRMFIEPLLGMWYPVNDFPLLGYINKYYCPGDEENIKFDFDFIGIQYYYRTVTKFSLVPPIVFMREVPADKRDVTTNQMGMEVYPKGLRHVVERYWNYPNMPKLLITESGVCFHDTLENGRVNDQQRLLYHQEILKEIVQMQKKGIDIAGYFAWSFTDNFEWAEGFNARFGLVHVDFDNQKRTIKDSGYWFQQFLSK